MIINKTWLKEKKACEDGREWFYKKFGKDAEIDSIIVLDALIADNRLSYANWYIVRIMERTQYLKYAIFSAEQVLHIHESKCLKDKRPRQAIDASKKVLEFDTKENRITAAHAATAAHSAADAYASDDPAHAAVRASAHTASAAAYVVAYASHATAYAYVAARKEMHLKILNYGRGVIKCLVSNT